MIVIAPMGEGCNSRRRFWVAALAAALFAAGCKPRSLPPSEARAAPASADAVDPTVERSASPSEVVAILHEARLARDYESIASFIVADRRTETVRFLTSVDRVLEANARLREAARQRFGRRGANAWNLSALQNNLGVFSADVDIISQTFRGDAAFVTLQEGENVPLLHPLFERTAEGWQLRPDPVPGGILTELDGLAGILDGIRESVEAGAGFEDYVEAFFSRALPQIQAVVRSGERPKIVASSGGDGD